MKNKTEQKNILWLMSNSMISFKMLLLVPVKIGALFRMQRLERQKYQNPNESDTSKKSVAWETCKCTNALLWTKKIFEKKTWSWDTFRYLI